MSAMIEFVEETHTYVCDGVIIPSVSELIRFKFPDAYKGVPDKVLKKKASYGTKVHQTIESFIRGEITLEELKNKRIDPNIKIAVEQFEALRKKWAFYVTEIEQVVAYKNHYAGTFDIKIEGDYLADIKTTSELHEEWLKWQLGLYYLAAGIRKDYGYVMWFPKEKEAVVKQIDVASHEECIQLVKDYEASKE